MFLFWNLRETPPVEPGTLLSVLPAQQPSPSSPHQEILPAVRRRPEVRPTAVPVSLATSTRERSGSLERKRRVHLMVHPLVLAHLALVRDERHVILPATITIAALVIVVAAPITLSLVFEEVYHR